MRNQDQLMPKYATLFYDVKRDLGIGWTDYIILDMIYHLSTRSGFCLKSVRAMARDLGMSFDAVRVSLNRLLDKELLLKFDEGYRCSDAYYDALSDHSDRKSVSSGKPTENRSRNRPKIGQTDRKQASTDRKQASQQMLELHENNNRKTHGTPRLLPRVPEQGKPLSATAQRLQARLNKIRKQQLGKAA